MKKLLLVPAAALIMALGSCGGSGNGTSGTIDTLDLKGEIIIPYDSLKQPYWVYVSDSKLYLRNTTSVDTLIEEYTLDGKFVRSFLNKGEGPNEVAFIYDAVADPYHKQLDIVKKPYSLEGLNLVGEPEQEHLFTFEVPEGTDNNSLDETQPNPSGSMVRFADGSILAGNMSRGGLLALFSPDGSFKQFAAPYPEKSEFGSGMPDYMIFNFLRPGISMSPDGKHFAAIMGPAYYMVFGELTGDTLNVRTICQDAPKGVNVEVHDGWSAFEYEDDYTIRLKYGPVTSADRVYLSHNSLPEKEYNALLKKMKEGEIPSETVLTEYDFQGNQVGAVRIDAIPYSIAVTPDNKSLYVITETAEDGIVVKRYKR